MIEKNWKELIKPHKLTVKHNNDQKSNATIIAEPIERELIVGSLRIH